MDGMIFDIERNSFADGPGIRTTVFFKGCNLRCEWCHNPESQKRSPQLMYYRDKCTDCGACKRVCDNDSCVLCGKCEEICLANARRICGRTYTVDEVFDEIVRDKPFYDASGGGVTFSGGECMLQLDFLLKLLKKCRQNGISTAIDTAGHVPFTSFERVLPYTDLFLYDVKLLDSKKHRRFTGVDNELILDNLKKLFELGARVWIRIPVIAGVNDDETSKIKEFIHSLGAPEKIELLPYHSIGENKYEAIGKKPPSFKAPIIK